MNFECEGWEMSSTPTKDVFAILSYEEWVLRKAVATETGCLLLEKYTIIENPVSHENCYCEKIGWFHLCDDVKGNVPGFDYTKDYDGWEAVVEALFERGLREENVDYIVLEDYDEF